MGMHPCPHCSGPGISTAEKLRLGPARRVECRTCGKKISVPYSGAMLAFLPSGIAIVLVPTVSGGIWPVGVLALAMGGAATFYLYLKHVPLVKR